MLTKSNSSRQTSCSQIMYTSKEKSFGWFEVSWYSFVLQIQSEHMSKIKIFYYSELLSACMNKKKEGSFSFAKCWAWLIKKKGKRLQNGYRYPVGLPISEYSLQSSLENCVLCKTEIPCTKGKRCFYHPLRDEREPKHDQTQKQSTSNIPKFKFLRNTVHINHFFSNNCVLFFLLM